MKAFHILISLTPFSCKPTNDFYQGRVTDEANNSLEGVMVILEDLEGHSITDVNGYFKLERSPNSLARSIFKKAGYESDTILCVLHQGGETVEYNFIKNNTSIVRLQLVDSI